MIFDAHTHIGRGRYKTLEPEDLLRQMDAAGVDRAVVCPVEEGIAVFNREANDYILAQTRRFPDRLVGFAVANPWFGEMAVSELERALVEGLRGLKLHPTVQGFSMNDPIAYPLVEVAARFGVPVYAHTGTAHFGEPLKLAELARRYPEVCFIAGHAGSSDFWADLGTCHRFAPNMYFETSRNGPSKYANLIKNIGVDFLLWGTNAPESLYEVELPNVTDVITEPGNLAKILGENLARVLREVPA